MKSFREGTAALDWDKAKILDMLKRAGREYRTQKKLAHMGKK
jgi:hypothetical protein